jgi:hypothetical protein
MEMTVPPAVKATERATASAALVVTPHPLTLQGQQVLGHQAAALVPGETLAAFVGRHGVQAGQQWVVTIGGVEVLEAQWHRVRPKPGHLVECRRVPQKDVLRIVAIVALSYFTLGAGGIGGGSFLGLTGAAGYIAAGVVFIAGSMVINKLLGPKQLSAAERTTSPTYSLNSGGRNQARMFQPLPLVLGEPYAVPDVGAQPFTFFRDGEQYLWQIFNLGLNCADAHTLRIGQTDLGAYTGVTVLRSGLASGNAPIPALGSSVDSVAGAELTAPAGFGPFVQRTSSAGTVRLAVDIVASLFSVAGNGAYSSRELDLTVEYRLVGSGTWLPMTPYVAGSPAVTYPLYGDGGQIQGYYVQTPAVPEVPAGVLRLVNASAKPLRRTLELDVAEGQYEVRLQKRHADFTGTAGGNQVQWASLKSYQKDTADYDGQARLAVQIQASGQLNGTLDELNGQLRAKPMPYWNGSAWVTAADRATGLCNPGAIFLLLARGIYGASGRLLFGLGYSDDRIDLEGLKRFMVRCAAKGFEFDLYLQDTTSIGELLDAVAYAGMGEVAWPDGKLGVTFFAEDDPITGVINMGTIKARSFSVSYDTRTTADELEGQYFDRARGDAWRSLRVLAPGVVTPRSTARLQLLGIGGEAHAATMARFVMGQNVYQRKSVELEMDLEYMTHRKGSVVALSHDMTAWGYSGRLMACEDVGGTVRLTLDDAVPATNPTGGASARYIGLRLAGESQMRVFPIKAFGGSARIVELDAAWPVGVALPGATADNPAQDSLWVYDFKATPGARMRVAAIKPMASSAGARLTLVPEPVEFWPYVLTGAYTPPPNNSLLRTAPKIENLRITEQLERQGNTFFTTLSITTEISGDFQRLEVWGNTGGEFQGLVKLGMSTSQQVSWTAGLDDVWALEVRAYATLNMSAPYRLLYTVKGLREKPDDVQAISVSGNVITLTANEPTDRAGYLLRFQYGDNTWWESAAPLHTGVVTESPYTMKNRPVGLVTVLAKQIDTTGNESENATSALYFFPEVLAANVLLAYAMDPTFPGSIANGTLVSGELVADALDNFYAPGDGPMYLPSSDPMYLASQYAAMVYEFTVIPTEAGTLRLALSITGGYTISYQTGGGDPMYTPTGDPLYEPPEDYLYGTPSAWQLWPGALEVDGSVEVRFRVTLDAGDTQGVISTLEALLDVPDVTERLAAVVVGSGGTRLPITKTYHAIKTVHLTVHSGGSGVAARIVDKDEVLGPMVQILDVSGAAVAGTLDADIQGF